MPEQNKETVVKVEMLVHTTNPDEIKKWEHHIDYVMDLDSYPDITCVSNVKTQIVNP